MQNIFSSIFMPPSATALPRDSDDPQRNLSSEIVKFGRSEAVCFSAACGSNGQTCCGSSPL